MKRYNPPLNKGLNDNEVNERINSGLVNYDASIKTKNVGQIISTNIFTLFNLLNAILASAIIFVGSYKNLLFMGVVVSNILISTIQEIRAKKMIDKLSIIASSKIKVIRNSKEEIVSMNEIVLDDLVKFSIGNQVITDSIIMDGECEVDESFITGESKSILKRKNDMLLSGSFIVSGSVIAKVEHIGEDNYTATISKEAKYIKKIKSEIMTSLNKVLMVLGIIIIPVGIILFLNQLDVPENTMQEAVINTVGALIGMIPEGLVLLTSTVFAVSVLRLSKYKVLVQELYAVETLARIDTLCLDKTGTITEGIMEVKEEVVLLKRYDLNEVLSNLSNGFKEENGTLLALKNKYASDVKYEIKEIVPFSSEKKWSGITFKDKGTYIIGAPEFVLKDTKEIDKYLKKYSEDYRILLLGHSINDFHNKNIPDNLKVIALILIQDKIRKEAREIIEYFTEKKVDIKLISGDNAVTVMNIAKRSGVKNYDKYVDLSKLINPNYDKLVKDYTVFGRVGPKEKKELILALKRNNKIVAMTGDGVNDVLALKEADCSIGIGSGTDAARNVSQLVLLDSNFEAVLRVVMEGRRSINNIERSSSLFLVKTIFATLLAIIFIFLPFPYPFMPIQLTLTSTVTIGLPALILALEPNHNMVKGKFLTNVISRAFPSALTIVINIILIMILTYFFNISSEEASTMAVISNGAVGFMLLYKISQPFNLIRKRLFFAMLILFIILAFALHHMFDLVMLSSIGIIIIAFVLLLSINIFRLFVRVYEMILERYPKWFN